MSKGDSVVKSIFVLIMFAAMAYASYSWHGFDKDYILIPQDTLPRYIVPVEQGTYIFFPEVPWYSQCWMGVQVLRGELEATEWIKQNTADTDKFVNDIPGAELVMGMTTRVSTVGGDWANAPHAVQDMYDNSEIYSTSDPKRAHDLAVGMNATYLVSPKRNVWAGAYDGPGYGEKFNDTRYFQPVYYNNDVTIYRVLP
ncbi:hypothetical protein [Methanocella sp. MCL-LM]|uniref:hypothetical protein n=1 Tax=Methanocella sp. MCL-LM TaxID=3412035 RepID=UPI003C733BE3